MTGQQLSDLQRIIDRIRKLSEDMRSEGLINYSLTLQRYAEDLEMVIW